MENMVNRTPASTFWQGRKIFLTGHTGFKGCWFYRFLEILGAQVFGYALPPNGNSLYASIYGQQSENGAYADIRDLNTLKREASVFAPDVVFHFAAQPLVRESYKRPIYTYETNVMGTLNLLEAVRSIESVKAVIIITTDKCYRDMGWEWGYRETDSLGGADPYSSSKACVELLCDAWRSSYFNKTGVALATVRAGNVIGGGDWADDRIVPDAMRAFQRGLPLVIRSPRAIRPWQHVLEPLYGYVLLAESLYDDREVFEKAWNFGPISSDARSVENVVQSIVALWGKEARYVISEDSSFRESQILRLDSSSAMQKIGWKPYLSFDDAISMTVDWYKRVYDGADALAVTDDQIISYMDRVGIHE